MIDQTPSIPERVFNFFFSKRLRDLSASRTAGRKKRLTVQTEFEALISELTLLSAVPKIIPLLIRVGPFRFCRGKDIVSSWCEILVCTYKRKLTDNLQFRFFKI